MNELEKVSESSVMEAVITGGDLAELTPAQRVKWYVMRCEAAGLDPHTQPFQYITLQGKLTLYATKTATEQLCAVRGISTQIVSREKADDLYIVTCRAILVTGRATESIGAVNIAGARGDALANALMKAETKAKRRAVLSLCGLGMLDETETETIPGAQFVEMPRSELPATTKGEAQQLTDTLPGVVITEQPAPIAKIDPRDVKFMASCGKLWPELAQRLPDYYAGKDGVLDSWHIRGALAKLGYSTITGDNVQAAYDALVKYANEQADQDAAQE